MNDITKTSVHWNVNYSFDARFPNTQEDEGGYGTERVHALFLMSLPVILVYEPLHPRPLEDARTSKYRDLTPIQQNLQSIVDSIAQLKSNEISRDVALLGNLSNLEIFCPNKGGLAFLAS